MIEKTEQPNKRKNGNDMRRAAIVALLGVIALCVLFLIIMLTLRALNQGTIEPLPLITAAPSPTAVPQPSPTPLVPSVLTFDEDAEEPMPAKNITLALGRGYPLRGAVQSNYPLTSVSLEINCAFSEDARYPYVQSVSFDPANAVYSYPLDDALTHEGVSLDSLTQFSALGVGIHTMRLYATSTGQITPEKIFETKFYILSNDWNTIQKSDFSNNSYESALKFFKEKDAFLYRYQWVDARYIVADPKWEEQYIISFDCLPGRDPWRIHKFALPYYEAASYYLNNVHVRVSGTNGDSGVLQLSDLIDTYNGSYCSRFTTSEKSISHHAFGTASDLNGGMGANDMQKENIALINTEVRDFLAYNGIKTEDGVSYYDYTYSGDSLIWTYQSIPETCINYILYELAFYRAGFQWGHYYVSTSDGMHFTLTDNIRISHDGNEGLRKVFDYSENYSNAE